MRKALTREGRGDDYGDNVQSADDDLPGFVPPMEHDDRCVDKADERYHEEEKHELQKERTIHTR